MGEIKDYKLGSLRLNDAEQQAIAELVDSDGFRVWAKKVMPTREIQIAGTALSALDEHGLYLARGMSLENRKQITLLQDIANKWNTKQD